MTKKTPKHQVEEKKKVLRTDEEGEAARKRPGEDMPERSRGRWESGGVIKPSEQRVASQLTVVALYWRQSFPEYVHPCFRGEKGKNQKPCHFWEIGVLQRHKVLTCLRCAALTVEQIASHFPLSAVALLFSATFKKESGSCPLHSDHVCGRQKLCENKSRLQVQRRPFFKRYLERLRAA